MNAEKMGLKVSSVALLVFLVYPLAVLADPCLVVYPTGPSEYHYDVNEYYTVGYGDSLYDPMYDRGGKVLIDINTNEIPYDIYQTQNLVGFKPSTDGNEGYFFVGSSFDLVIDGFTNEPTTFTNIILVFEPDPEACSPTITVDGNPVMGGTYAIGNLTVSTPTEMGNNYSDTIVKSITWMGCYGVRIWAFADENYNGINDGNECFTAFSHDSTVPTETRSWGAIKSLYQ
ncbi:MAG: hypothetical protein JSW50_07185 [Candidatus Latescibacterota bacterium]|nr:MAG: hypothetical protein JSW50_07185 [Candidatus Latescibacterota bacterium]